MKHATSYILTALLLYIIGFFTLDWYWFAGAVIISALAFYWIRKEGKKN